MTYFDDVSQQKWNSQFRRKTNLVTKSALQGVEDAIISVKQPPKHSSQLFQVATDPPDLQERDPA